MSAATDVRPVSSAADTWTIGAPRLLAGLDALPSLNLAAHTAIHGAPPAMDRDRLLTLLDASRLSGRGGAGFPLASKLRALHGTHLRVIVNGSESEPASFKDRTLLRRTPHLVLDGAVAVAAALQAREVVVAVHDAAAHESVRRAISERPGRGSIRLVRRDGRFVGGEARALVRGIDGGPTVPPGRREHPGLTGNLVSNAETFAQAAILLRRGARGFAETGTHDEPGTVLLTIGGGVARPGVVEAPIGTPLGILLTAAQAAPATAVVAGGYHGSWIHPFPDIRVSRAGLAAAGGSLGAGVLYVVDDATCGLGELAQVTGWLAAQSAKQCGPCRFGLPALAADVAALAAGQPAALSQAFAHARAVDGRGACSHPDGAVRFASSGLHVLQDEIDAHRRGGCGRRVLGRLPITGGSR